MVQMKNETLFVTCSYMKGIAAEFIAAIFYCQSSMYDTWFVHI